MDLLRVLLMSYGPVLKKREGVMPGSADASREIIELVDQLQGTPLQDEAIAMANRVTIMKSCCRYLKPQMLFKKPALRIG